MSESTVQDKPQVAGGVAEDPFDLDVNVLEVGAGTVPLIMLTDDGCNPSCPESCATNVA